jgi:hypothetical protein
MSGLGRRCLPLCALSALLAWHVEAMASLRDGGELSAAAVDLGASHPPGQTLHALLGYFASWLPIGGVVARLSLFSAACVLVAAWLAARLTAALCDELGVEASRTRALAELAALLGVPLSLPVLRQSLRVEVYTLALALLLLGSLLLVRWAQSARPGSLWAAAFVSGLSMAVHPPHALSIAITAACLGALAPRRLLGSRRALLGALGFGLLGLFVLAYLPTRAAAGAGSWGDPRTVSGFVDYVTARAYAGNLATHDRLALLAEYARHLLQVSSGVPLLGALLVLWPRVTRPSPVARGMLLSALAALSTAGLQPLEVDNPDNVAYLAPALALLLVTGAAGLAALAQRGPRVLGVLLLCALALPPATALQLPERLRADAPALETLASVLAEAPPPRALVIVTGEHASTTWLMLERVERVRPDVAVLVKGLSTSSWHWARLRSRPGLSRPQRIGGGDAHDAFARGAALASLAHVPVALEQDLPGLRPNLLDGPYVVLDPRRPPGDMQGATRSLAERWLRQLSDEALGEPEGDAHAAARVVQELLTRRAARFQVLIGASPR